MQIASRPRSLDLYSLHVWSRCQACFVFLNSFCNSIEYKYVLDKVVEKCWCWITILFALTFYCLLSETRGQQPLQPSHSTIQGAIQCQSLQCAMQCQSTQCTVQCSGLKLKDSYCIVEWFTMRHVANSTVQQVPCRTLHWQSTLDRRSRVSWSGGLTKGPTSAEMTRSLERVGQSDLKLTSGKV